ncbi:hypothetical protein FA13DRAFT_1292694 [Coprinellus micaceus]|uniref:Uncharacterized protein n=1 Tax=Coprinellus micaceus TaxID=71717 RepID=A0A4Y7SS94_COPMI|nr:hypothetical protein FA13DRAFT_1292694 [Coprinellus micaceus]
MAGISDQPPASTTCPGLREGMRGGSETSGTRKKGQSVWCKRTSLVQDLLLLVHANDSCRQPTLCRGVVVPHCISVLWRLQLRLFLPFLNRGLKRRAPTYPQPLNIVSLPRKPITESVEPARLGKQLQKVIFLGMNRLVAAMRRNGGRSVQPFAKYHQRPCSIGGIKVCHR